MAFSKSERFKKTLNFGKKDVTDKNRPKLIQSWTDKVNQWNFSRFNDCFELLLPNIAPCHVENCCPWKTNNNNKKYIERWRVVQLYELLAPHPPPLTLWLIYIDSNSPWPISKSINENKRKTKQSLLINTFCRSSSLQPNWHSSSIMINKNTYKQMFNFYLLIA